jgi:predicted GNAT family acetyltransferase
MHDRLIDNAAKGRFELIDDEGELVFANYRRGPDRLILTHVETDPAARGKGLAGRLMDLIVAEARARKLKIEARCPYVVYWFEEHPGEERELRIRPQTPQDGTDGEAFVGEV